MKIKINNKETEINENSSVSSLSSYIDIPEKGIAIAVNNSIIPRAEWDSFKLSQNDNLIIIKAACGG